MTKAELQKKVAVLEAAVAREQEVKSGLSFE